MTATEEIPARNAVNEAREAMILYQWARQQEGLRPDEIPALLKFECNTGEFMVTTVENEPKTLAALRTGADGRIHVTGEKNLDIMLHVDPEGREITMKAHNPIDREAGQTMERRARGELERLRNLWPIQPENEEPILNTVAVTLAEAVRQASIGYHLEQREFDRALREAAPQIAKPRVVAWMAQLGRAFTDGQYSANIEEHNLFAVNIPALDALEPGNPGAAAWAIRRWDQCMYPRHQDPAAMLEAVRRDMADYGMDKPTIRASVRPGTPLPALLEAAAPLPEAAIAMGVIQRHNIALQRPEPLAGILRAANECALHRLPEWPNGRPDTGEQQRYHAVIEALVLKECRAQRDGQHQPWSRQSRDQIRDVFDWLASMNGTAAEIPPGTGWRGMLRMCREWHRQQARNKYRHQWENLLQQQQGQFLSWRSLLPETREDGVVFIPLETELDLYQESMTMDHCVIQYGRSAASGNRLFHVDVNTGGDGGDGYTVQLSRVNGAWRPVQTRGRRNAPPPPEIEQAAQRLAQLYQDAWDQATEEEQNSPPAMMAAATV